ncbi:MAG: hypothetical protein Q7R40_06445 [Phaeospirillum sp.]|nr:hypothetical protein [Phaeospirillum sp.]
MHNSVTCGALWCQNAHMKTTEEHSMPHTALETLRGNELPRSLAVQFEDGTADDVYIVEARRLSPEDAAKLATLRADVQAGLDQLDAGQGKPLDIESLLKRLKSTATNA